MMACCHGHAWLVPCPALQVELRQLVRALARAQGDKRVKGLITYVGGREHLGGLATVQVRGPAPVWHACTYACMHMEVRSLPAGRPVCLEYKEAKRCCGPFCSSM